MKEAKANEIMEKVKAEWAKKTPKGAHVDKRQLRAIKNTLLQSPHEDGFMRITVMTEKGDSTHLVPFEDLITKGISGKQALAYPKEILNIPELSEKDVDDATDLYTKKLRIPTKIQKEIEHLKKTKIPRCQTCKKNFVKVDEYTWKPNCEHAKRLRVSIG
jgi:hypothetical protein